MIHSLNFQVERGDYLCVAGENGSGKSTLIKGLLRLIKPVSGEIMIDKDLKPGQVGYMPQQTVVQKDFPASVFEVVLSGRLSAQGIRPFYSRKDKQAALHNLELLGALHLRRKCYRELSGGQQQRVLLCRALCATEKLLLLDEPVSGLDPLVTQEMYRLIKRVNAEMGVTVIMVSHDIRNAVEQASHVLHLRQEQLFFGPADAYRQSPMGRLFLGGEPVD